jgi:hypothetical protein
MIETLSLALGSSWASGLNLYAALSVMGLLQYLDKIRLPESMAVIGEPVVIAVALFFYCIEFFADKIPLVDSLWDGLQGFVKIPAGAVLAAGSVYDVAPEYMLIAGLGGLGVAASSHLSNASMRLAVNASPEPVSNIAASAGKDLTTVAGIWSAINYPWFFIAAFILWCTALIIFWKKLSRKVSNYKQEN